MIGNQGFRSAPLSIWIFIALSIFFSQFALPCWNDSKDFVPFATWNLFSSVSAQIQFIELEIGSAAEACSISNCQGLNRTLGSKRFFYQTQYLGGAWLRQDPSALRQTVQYENVLRRFTIEPYRLYLSKIDSRLFLASGVVQREKLIYDSQVTP